MNHPNPSKLARGVAAVVALLFSISCGPSDPLPPSTILDIPLLTQSVPSRSWITCGRMIYRFRDSTFALTECEMQSYARMLYVDCCPDQSTCDTAYTTINQPTLYLSGIVRKFYTFSKTTPTLEWMQSYLHEHRFAGMALMKGSPYQSSGHFVVVRGIKYDTSNTNPIILINDPLGYFPNEMRFKDFSSQCQAAAFLA